jgi:hypothetical protein
VRRSYQYCLGFFSLLICSTVSAQAPPFDQSFQDGDQTFLPETQLTSYDEYQGESFPTGLEQRVQQLEAHLNELRNRPVYDPIATLDHQLRRQDAGTGGLFGTIEVTFLRPHLAGSPSFFASAGAATRFIDSDYQTNVRYQLGYKSDSGVGIRGRYWSYDHDFSYVPPWTPGQYGIALSATDLELTLDQRLRHFDLEVSAGVRYGNLVYSNGTPTLFGLIGVGRLTIEGIGPTASIGARRALGNSGFSVFGSLRGSVLVGDLRNGSVLWNMPSGKIEDEIMTVAENQMGVAYTRTLSNNMVFELRTGWETQYWMNSTLEDDFYGIGSNLGLSGPTVAVELKF